MAHTSSAVHVLPLSPPELWTVYHVLLARIDSERRDHPADEPPPAEVFHAIEKVEAGESRFTPRELRCIHAELRRYLERKERNLPNRIAVERVISRITDALANRPPYPSIRAKRRQRPR